MLFQHSFHLLLYSDFFLKVQIMSLAYFGWLPYLQSETECSSLFHSYRIVGRSNLIFIAFFFFHSEQLPWFLKLHYLCFHLSHIVQKFNCLSKNQSIINANRQFHLLLEILLLEIARCRLHLKRSIPSTRFAECLVLQLSTRLRHRM